MRTYGTVKLQDNTWILDVEPHVRGRLKRIFPRMNTYSSGVVSLGDTPEIANDILWVMERWPMEVEPASEPYLRSRASSYCEQRDTVTSILEGYGPPTEWREAGITPRDYQEVAANLVHTTGRLLLCDDLGLGKTISSLLLLRDPETLPAAVVTLTHLPKQWEREIETALPWLKPHIIRLGPVYDPMSETGGRLFTDSGADVLILGYSKLAKWGDYLAGRVKTIIFDEAQELRTGDKAQKYVAAKLVARRCKWRMGLTATPVYNYGGEMHNVVSVLDDDVLGTRPEFLREWCTEGGDKALVKEPEALGTFLRDQGVMLRRTRRDVGRELPPVQRIMHSIDIDDEKLDELSSGAVALAEMILANEGSNTDLWRASGDLDWKLRLATGVAKAKYVAQFVKLLVESGEPVVLFGWHHDVYNIWKQELKFLRPAFYTGDESPQQKNEMARRFLEGETDVLVMSLRAGAGLDGLQARCRVGVFGELDWSPGVHAQCIGRLNRDGQDDQVLAYFLVAESGSDPVVADVLNLKRQQADPIVDPDSAKGAVQQVDTTDRMRRLAEDFLRRRGELPQLVGPDGAPVR